MLTNEQDQRRTLLYILGAEIRKRGKPFPVKHGCHWDLILPNGIRFYHDDFNHAITAFFPDGRGRFIPLYFGCDFGGFESKATIEQFNDALNGVRLTNYKEA